MEKKKTVSDGPQQTSGIRLNLEELKRQWIACPSLELEAEICRLEWLLARSTGTLN